MVISCLLPGKLFNALIQPLINQTIDCCKQALKDAQIDNGSIDAVVMVGGSTRVPAVKEAVSLLFRSACE